MSSSKRQTVWVEIFTPYIVRNGRIIYPKTAKYFHFWVKK